jgi:hypothetical protein
MASSVAFQLQREPPSLMRRCAGAGNGEFFAFRKPAFEHVEVEQHLTEHSSNGAWPEVVGFVEAFDVAEDFLATQSVIFQCRGLLAVRIDESTVFAEPAVLLRLPVQFRSRIRRGEADLK